MWQLPEAERWPAQVFIALMGILAIEARISNQVATATVNTNPPPDPAPNPGPLTPACLKSFVRENCQAILLSSDLDAYSRQGVRKNHAAQTPFSIMKVRSIALTMLPHNI